MVKVSGQVPPPASIVAAGPKVVNVSKSSRRKQTSKNRVENRVVVLTNPIVQTNWGLVQTAVNDLLVIKSLVRARVSLQ